MIKRIGRSDIIGEQGIALIRQIVLGMGFMFYETGGVEAGIDGIIELRDDVTGEVSNQILQVQGKATEQALAAETETSFEFTCTEADIQYWRSGTAPVLLIVARPSAGVAYWKSIKNWFASDEAVQARKVKFDKTSDLFNKDAKDAIIAVATGTRPGSTGPNVRRREALIPNLLAVSYAPRLFWAPTTLGSNKQFGAAIREIDPKVPGEWIVKSGAVLSFRNLDEYPWRKLCESGAMEEFDTVEWAESDDEDRQRDFVQLLNRALNVLVEPDLRFDKDASVHYFTKRRDREERHYVYRGLAKTATRRVVGRYAKKKAPADTAFYRHSAFRSHFVRLEGRWYLEVNPTYRFTRDGWKESLFAGDQLKKIKELENNAAVMGQFLMWRHFLTSRNAEDDLYQDKYPFLSFSALPDFELATGVPDELWKSQEQDPASPLFDAERVDE